MNVTIFGKGVIDGQGPALKAFIDAQQKKGYVAADVPVPAILSFKDCKGIVLRTFIFRNPATPSLFVAENSEVVEDGCYTDTPL